MGFESAYERLRGIADVKVDAGTRTFLDGLRKLRNRIQHFAIDIELDAVHSVVAKGLNFFVEFSVREVDFDASVDRDTVDAIYERLRDLERFVNERLDSIREQLKRLETVACPRCWQSTMVLGDDAPHCLFCGLGVDAEELAGEISEGEVETCPQCGSETCALIIYNNETSGWLCTTCGVRGDYGRCERCGELADGEFCDSCLEVLRLDD